MHVAALLGHGKLSPHHPMKRLIVVFALSLGVCLPAWAQASRANLELFYNRAKKALVYFDSTMQRPYMELGFREPVYTMLEGNGWSYVRTQRGAKGFTRTDNLSNVWIKVSKSKATVYVYEGTKLLHSFPADFGYNAFADKVKRGSSVEKDHWRTPEGSFYVARKNPHSKYYKALVLNYPNTEDAERGLKQGLITQEQYNAIVISERTYSMPPMNTPLGGWIEIHGDGTGARSNWTHGCVAIRNTDIERIWDIVDVGTPVLVQP